MHVVNPLMGTLKPQSNGPLYSNTVIVTLAVDGWAVAFSTARRRQGELRSAAPPRTLLAVPSITAHPSTASVPGTKYIIRRSTIITSALG